MNERARRLASLIDQNIVKEVLQEAFMKAACSQIDFILDKKYNTMLESWAEDMAEQTVTFHECIELDSNVAANVNFVKYFAAHFTD